MDLLLLLAPMPPVVFSDAGLDVGAMSEQTHKSRPRTVALLSDCVPGRLVSSSLCALGPWSRMLRFSGVDCGGVLGDSALPGGAAQPYMALKRCWGGVGEAVFGEGAAVVRARFTGDASSALSRVLLLAMLKCWQRVFGLPGEAVHSRPAVRKLTHPSTPTSSASLLQLHGRRGQQRGSRSGHPHAHGHTGATAAELLPCLWRRAEWCVRVLRWQTRRTQPSARFTGGHVKGMTPSTFECLGLERVDKDVFNNTLTGRV
jgi:hypothetical protein